MFDKKKLVEQLKKDFKSIDGGLMYSFEPGRWDRHFEKQAEIMMKSMPKPSITSQLPFGLKSSIPTPHYKTYNY